jgi:phospholipase/carboxylesterase
MLADAYVYKTVPGEGPLLFLFHGTGGDENQLLGFGGELLPGARLIAPRGDVSEFGAARFFRRTGEGVYDMDDLARATARMAGFVHAHADAVHPPAVLGLGYSNGANILASVLFAKPDLFDAAVLMHPLIPFEPKIDGDLAGRKILITAGRHDPICPPNLTSRLEAHLRDKGADVTLVWHEGGHEIRPVEVEAARVFLGRGRRGEAGMTGEPEIRLEDSGSKGSYVLEKDGAVAEMTFSKAGEHLLIIDHTEVPDAFRGQGVGVRLVSRAVEDARASGKKIIPLCPFANAQFRKHPEWADVLGGKAR